jgi:adenosylcobinamide kinase / adenosylcobinamide-phosphate guanylyltransferase
MPDDVPMNLTLLGTGSADGWPNPHCGCPSCRSSRASGTLRGQTAALLDDALLLDCGPDSAAAAQRAGLDLTRLRHVLVTHAERDHCAPELLQYRSWVDADAPLDLLGPPEVVERASRWVAPDSPVRFVAVAAGDRTTLGAYDVRVLAAGHGTPGSGVLYDVTGPSGRLLYATDTGPLPDETLDAVTGAGFDVVLLEETFGDHRTHGTDHLDLGTFPQQLRRLRAVGAVTSATDVVAVHLSHHNPPTPELSRRLSDWQARVVPDGTTLGHRLGDRPAPATGGRTLVIGGARSGKSQEAERLLAAEQEVCYVATAYPPDRADHDGDAEWAERVRLHRVRRPTHWSTSETVDLVPLLASGGAPLLIDCLTLWLTRVMDRHDAWDDAAWAAAGEKGVHDEIEVLVSAWRATPRRVVAVTNEVGQGVVPDSTAGRRFRDTMGRLNARLSAETEDVRWCVAGRVVQL